MNVKIETQSISPEQREKIIENLKLGMRSLIGQHINRKSKSDFRNIIKDTMKKNKVTIMFDDDGNAVMPSK
jgi:hypothetical protein